MEKCEKCGEYSVYVDLFNRDKKTCRNSGCNWKVPLQTDGDIPEEIRKKGKILETADIAVSV